MGGINVLQSVMIADCVDYEELPQRRAYRRCILLRPVLYHQAVRRYRSILSAVVYHFVGYSDANILKLNEA